MIGISSFSEEVTLIKPVRNVLVYTLPQMNINSNFKI